MGIEEIYTSTPGINRKLHIGSNVGPTFLRFIQIYASKINQKISTHMMLNCHSPEFNKLDTSAWNIEKHVEDRIKEYNKLNINYHNTNIERDDLRKQETINVIKELLDKEYFSVKQGSLYFDISKAKKVGREKINQVNIYPAAFQKQYESYLNQEEDIRDLTRNLKYGLLLPELEIYKPVSQVQELIYHGIESSKEKLVISGKNVLGHYGFQVALLHSILHDKPIHLLIHSTFKVDKNLFANKIIDINDISSYGDNIISGHTLSKLVTLSAITDQERAHINQPQINQIKKLINKANNIYQIDKGNLQTKIAKHHQISQQPTIESFLSKYSSNLLDKLFLDTMLTSRLCEEHLSKKTKNILFQNKNYSFIQTDAILAGILND